MKWNSKRIAEQAKKDFEKMWLETGELAEGKGLRKSYPKEKGETGRPHEIFETIQKLRKAYLDLGFDEVINPVIIEDSQVHKQFGPEATAVLDRCYYLGGLPRPDVGLSAEKVEKIKGYGVKVDKDRVQEVLHRYKKGEFDGEDLTYKLAGILEVEDQIATKILNEVFPEFKVLEPVSTRATLRSHMTSGWFLTLRSVVGKRPFPIKLFSIDRCFRREQQEDESHLRVYHSASCVIADEEVSVEDGKDVARSLLKQFGFKDFKFQLDKKRSKYYAPGTQTEVYARLKKGRWVEIATLGMYSPVALSGYKMEYPVMNLGLGVERLSMVTSGSEDIRAVVYPHFHAEWRLEDKDIASMLYLEKEPVTKEGREIVKQIVRIGEERADESSPCSFLVYKGKVLDKEVRVELVEVEDNKRLLGPAAFNEIYVYNGNISGIPSKGFREIRKRGTNTNIRYIDGIASLATYEIERGILDGKKEIKTRVPMVKGLSDINLKLDDSALRYITGKNKTIDVRGPVFMTIYTKVMDMQASATH